MFTHHSLLATHHAPGRRRGVLLLVVLILLVLFVMMAVTYVLVATRQLSASKAYARKDATGDPPPQQLDGVMMQLVRGSTNQHSVLYPHSLLEHMYGPYTAVGSLGSQVTDATGGQIVEFQVPATNLAAANSAFSLNSSVLGYDGYLDGCVITMTSGTAKGLTSRIVRYDATGTTPIFHILAFKGTSGPITPSSGDSFIINGRAFSGTGFGFNPNDGVLDAKDADPAFPPSGKEFALLPNPVSYNPTQFAGSNYTSSIPFGGIGGGNMDYDAPDYQHMFMSWTVMNSATGQAQTILPSFHRPDLINYWRNRIANQTIFASGGWTNWNSTTYFGNYTDPITGGKLTDSQYLLERIMLRPNPIDHPNFTGSNNYLSAANFASNIAWNPSSGTPCPWDVDNDGDGVPDSVWIDAGYPVQTAPDGKLYKPLFAILCVDLDGRLNVNAAGTTEQLAATHSQQITGPYAGSSQTVTLPRGEGLGPADINLFDPANPTVPSPLTQTQAAQLMQGGTVNSQTYDGRYGDSGTSNPAGPQAGVPGQATLLGEVMRFQYPKNSFNPPSTILPLSSFGSPADLWGQMAVGLDFRGQPLFWKPAWTGETKNDPYDMNLSVGGTDQASGSTSADNPFSVFDLERLLRQYDVDTAELPRRLWDLSGINALPSNTAQQVSKLLTTDSWDPPSPGVVAPDYLRAGGPLSPLSKLYGRNFATNILELLAARISNDNPTWTTAQVNSVVSSQARKLLSPELIAGLRMSINRPLGDGRDGNGNNVVDEPAGTAYGSPWDNGTAETATEGKSTSVNPWSWLDSSLANAGFPPVPALDLVNGQNVTGPDSSGVYHDSTTDQLLARQLLARHLYVLARLMIGDDFLHSANNHWFANETAIDSDTSLYGPKMQMSIRRIAQWAINVVDFMDPDNIMTPFEYDVAPFSATYTDPTTAITSAKNIWGVDGIIDANSSQPGYTGDDNQPWRRLVWGCEGQPLLISEVLALHDRRVADTTNDPSSKNRSSTPPDPDLDQVRIPEGSLFVELYATHNPNNPTASGDLYTLQGSTWYLNLGAMAPAGNDGVSGSAQYPVWRLAISKPHTGGGTTTPSPRTFAQTNVNPSSASFETEQYVGEADPTNPNYDANYTGSLLKTPNTVGTGTKVQIDRYVWFWSQDPFAVSARDANRIYYARTYNNPYAANTAYIPPGGYVVVGPRDSTSIGSANNTLPANSTSMSPQNWGYPSPEKISLSQMAALGSGVTDTNSVSMYATSSQIKAPVTIVAAADPPTSWNPATLNLTAPTGIGINVSEPLPNQPATEANYSAYYSEPTNVNTASGKQDAYDNLASPTGTFLNTPFEKLNGAGALPNAPVGLLPAPPNDPAGGGPETATTMNYRTVFLQRLANPLAPYHPVTNPYLTVDWMPVDLTVFNGEDHKPASWNDSTQGQWDPDDHNPNGDLPNVMAFSSRQRGQFSTYNTTYTNFNLWSQWPDPTQASGTPTFNLGGENPQFDSGPNTALSTVNFQFTVNDTDAVQTGAGVGNASLGFLNHSYGPPRTSSDPGVTAYPQYLGDPQKPFPWLTWNNRPFENIAELMLVPATHPGRLLYDIGYNGCKWTGANVYLGTAINLQPYNQLLNFFNTSTTSGNSANLSQIFEYLQVPSPFVGTQEVLNPQTFAWSGGAIGEPSSTPAGAEPAGTAGLHPPFNMVSNYRDPGKVNINTIAGGIDSAGVPKSHVWDAILGGNPSALGSTAIGPTFADVVTSRRGYSITSSNPYTFDPGHPSIFSKPFRSGAASDLVPLASLQPTEGPVEATIFRPGVANVNIPLLIGTVPSSPYNDGTRNPYFTYQGLERLTSKLTTRSNVYAVWITVGYFEVTPWYGINSLTGAPFTTGPQVFDTAHADGYQLGQELGADTGQVQRHRAFYIIDRSIPVGFQRGYDINVNNAVLLKRFIE